MRSKVLIALACSVSAFATAAAAQPVAQVEEVIVTAQKREERLQQVPLTVSAITASQLERSGVSGTRDLLQLTPGLNLVQTSFVPQAVIRGVGTRGVGPGDESTVPIYVDGVYVSLQAANAFELSNIERVEVVKGPQGTLFGRNAVGGAINVLTKDPKHSFEGKLAASYGSFHKREGELYISGPLSDTLAANLSVYGAADDGYIKDLVHGGNVNPASTSVYRGKLLWTPTDRTEVKLIANYTFVIDSSAVAFHPYNGITTARRANPPVYFPGKFELASDQPILSQFFTEGASLHARQKFSFMDLTAIGSYQYSKNFSNQEQDGTVFNAGSITTQRSRDQAYTGEVRATSTMDGPLKWIAGIYGFQAKSCYCDLVNTNVPLRAVQRAKAFAVFGEATYALGDLSATAGLRYSHEKRSIFTTRSGLFIGDGSKSFSKVTPRVSLTYNFSERARVYGTYSQGFKSGVYNASSVATPLVPVNPETLDAFEVGFKSEPSRQLQVNLSTYLYNYDNLQVVARNFTTGATLLQNAAKARMYGAELQFAYAATPYWNISGGAAYTHARFVRFPGASVVSPRPDLIGTQSVTADVAGNAVPRSPDWNVSLRSDYTVPLSVGKLTFAGNVYYSSKYYFDFGNLFPQKAYVIVNARATWTSEDGRYRVTGFVDNATNNDRILSLSTNTIAIVQTDSRPRSYGVKVEYAF